jgi:hypothetical protein
MAKVPFSKLQASVNGCDACVSYMNRSGEEIKYEVKHYLPFKEKLELVSNIINKSVDDNGFYNPMRVKMNMVLEVTYAYTNLSFTEKMKDDPFKLYDILVSTGIFTDIVNVIREKDWTEIQDSVWATIKNIYDYKNSAMGILENISADYSGLSLEAAEIQKQLNEGNGIEFLKEVMTKLG